MLDLKLIAESGQLFDHHYKLIRPLSTDGGTADVWLALDMNTVKDPSTVGDLTKLYDDEVEALGLIVAIKIYRPQNALDIEGEQRFREEYMIVYNCHHTNLIHPTNFSIYQETPYLVLPYCKLGSSDLLIGNMPNAEVMWKFIGDVSSGLAYLHALNPPIIHQDIKPGNVLIDDNLNYAITDFGISAKDCGGSNTDEEAEERSGTMAYMSPERFNEGAEPNQASDIWALGATLCELVTGELPFGEEGGWTQVQQQMPMPDLPNMPSDIKRLIHACMDIDPEKRPTADYISKAAAAHQFPLKKKKTGLIIGIIALCALLIGIGVTYLLKDSEVQIVTEESTPPEVVYEKAIGLLNSTIPDSVKVGAEMMDSLSGIKYPPAIYEMAFTYGWFSDSVSVARKKMLGIDIFESGDSKYLPTSDRWSNKAVALFTTMLELKDSTYAAKNAEAAYRLACYYEVPNAIFQRNLEKSKKFLLVAKDWAQLSGNNALLERVNNGLERIGAK